MKGTDGIINDNQAIRRLTMMRYLHHRMQSLVYLKEWSQTTSSESLAS